MFKVFKHRIKLRESIMNPEKKFMGYNTTLENYSDGYIKTPRKKLKGYFTYPGNYSRGYIETPVKYLWGHITIPEKSS